MRLAIIQAAVSYHSGYVGGRVDGATETEVAKLSDRGENAARMYAALEPEQDAPDRDQELAGAVLRLVVTGLDYLVPTLLLIAKNGSDREKSMKRLSARTYFRHRTLLEDFFVAHSCTRRYRGA